MEYLHCIHRTGSWARRRRRYDVFFFCVRKKLRAESPILNVPHWGVPIHSACSDNKGLWACDVSLNVEWRKCRIPTQQPRANIGTCLINDNGLANAQRQCMCMYLFVCSRDRTRFALSWHKQNRKVNTEHTNTHTLRNDLVCAFRACCLRWRCMLASSSSFVCRAWRGRDKHHGAFSCCYCVLRIIYTLMWRRSIIHIAHIKCTHTRTHTGQTRHKVCSTPITHTRAQTTLWLSWALLLAVSVPARVGVVIHLLPLSACMLVLVRTQHHQAHMNNAPIVIASFTNAFGSLSMNTLFRIVFDANMFYYMLCLWYS